MSQIIGFTDFVENRLPRTPQSLAGRQKCHQSSFTVRDRQDLDHWSSEDHRVSIFPSDMGTFAMVYEAGRSWASWGVVRQGRSVLLWDCVTLADIGHFPSMIDALAAVPLDDLPAPVANVIQLAAARARMAQPVGRP